MLNTAGSLVGAESTGIFPCVTYTAGVSGGISGIDDGENSAAKCFQAAVGLSVFCILESQVLTMSELSHSI